MLADQDSVEAFFHQLLAGPGNGVDAGVEGGGDVAVPPSFARLRGIGFQQNAGLGQLSGRVLTRMDQVLSCSLSSSLSFTMYLFSAVCFVVTKHLRHCGVSEVRDLPQNQ